MVRFLLCLCLVMLRQPAMAEVDVDLAYGRLRLGGAWHSSPNPVNSSYVTLRSPTKDVEVNVAVKRQRELSLDQLNRAGRPMHEGALQALREELGGLQATALVTSSTLQRSFDGWVSEWRGMFSNGESFLCRTYIRRASTSIVIVSSRLRDEALLVRALEEVVAGMTWQ